jgi:hypothetical protein
LQEKISAIKKLLSQTLDYLNNINDANFKSNLDNSLKNMQSVELLRKELMSIYGKEQLKINESELIELTKLIQKRFDNIVRLKRTEAEEISKNLNQAQNQKKLANYIR